MVKKTSSRKKKSVRKRKSVRKSSNKFKRYKKSYKFHKKKQIGSSSVTRNPLSTGKSPKDLSARERSQEKEKVRTEQKAVFQTKSKKRKTRPGMFQKDPKASSRTTSKETTQLMNPASDSTPPTSAPSISPSATGKKSESICVGQSKKRCERNAACRWGKCSGDRCWSKKRCLPIS